MASPVPNITESKECKKCGELIFYAYNVYGEMVPLDAIPEERYNLTRNTGGQLVADKQQVFTTHFNTCRNKTEDSYE